MEGWEKIDDSRFYLNILINERLERFPLTADFNYGYLHDMITITTGTSKWTLLFDGTPVKNSTPISSLYGKKVSFSFQGINDNSWSLHENTYYFSIKVLGLIYSFRQEYDTHIGKSLVRIIESNPDHYFIFSINGNVIRHFDYTIQDVYNKCLSCEAINLRNY